MKIAIIGAGNMGGAVARALAKGKKVKRSDITVSNPSIGKLEALKADFPDIHVTTDNREAYIAGQLIILAVKPWKIQGVLEELKDLFKNSNRMMASMAAGVSTTQIGEWMALPQETTEKDEEVLNIFGECGVAMMVDEAMIASGTALASCGIAYAMRYLRAAMEGGVELGFYPNDAQKIVMQTMKGAVELLQAKGSHPETEIDRVTTPGGITIKGLNAMEEAGFTASVIEGLRASK